MTQQQNNSAAQTGIPVAKLDYTGLPPEIYCPACGHDVCTDKGPGENYCEHVCLIHTDMSDEVEWVKEGLEEKWIAAITRHAADANVELDDDYSLDDYVFDMEWAETFQSLCDIVESPSAFGLQITTSQMPDSGSVLVVFDMKSKSE